MEMRSEIYKGNLSENPQISLGYTNVKGGDYNGKDKIQGIVCLVNLKSDNPSLWKILT